jgi:OHCU decarboxylase
LSAQRPFTDLNALCEAADTHWRNLERDDWLEAFSRHPQIGEKAATGSESHRRWAEGEQTGARIATEDVKTRLAGKNRAYYEKFGYIFIVCAAGKSAEEMLALLEQRLQNDPARELPIAAEQQRQITRLRLEKLLAGERSS